MGEEPYYYGSHYSNAGSVLHYLVRVEPFTQLFLDFQSGRFDAADRMFHDLKHTWDLSSTISSTDVKELIPEMFSLPELFVNANRNDFGKKQDGEVVDDVKLPPWANGDPRRFIALHREALESEYVSAHLHHWIDLIFGCKQTGSAAKEACNLFLPLSYEGSIDINATTDEVTRNAQWAIVRSFGQTPKLLFNRAHPQRTNTAPDPSVFTNHFSTSSMSVTWHRRVRLSFCVVAH